MAVESPLFQSSMELLGHSISHFNGSRELDRKLVILHLANAIELILKDLVLDMGESIYKNPKETVTIHGCIESLKARSVALPYLNKIELLIDERNSLQHRYGSPNELTTIFYMNIAVEFFRCIVRDNYGQDFDEIIEQFADEKDLLAFRMREPADESELENLKKLAKVHPLGALLSAAAYSEKVLADFYVKIGLQQFGASRRYPASHTFLAHYGVSPNEEVMAGMDEARQLRNLATHGKKDPAREEVVRAINAIEKYENFLRNVPVDEVRARIEKRIEEEKMRREPLGKIVSIEGLDPK